MFTKINCLIKEIFKNKKEDVNYENVVNEIKRNIYLKEKDLEKNSKRFSI